MKSKRVAATVAVSLCILCACSNGGINTPAQTASTKATTAAVSVPANACDRKLVTEQDAIGVLGTPVTGTKSILGDAQSCEFTTAGFESLTVTVRPGHGMAAVGMYTTGKMDAYDKSQPLGGVGDEAVRSLSLNRITARKGDLLCEITGPGLATSSIDLTTQKLGALCNKIFAAY